MPFDRQQLREYTEQKRHDKVRENRTELRVLAQAQVPITKVTKSAEWNYFLSLLQAKQEELEVSLNAYQQALVTTMAFDHAELAATKARAMVMKVQIDTLQSVIDLPKQILEAGKEASLALADYDNG